MSSGARNTTPLPHALSSLAPLTLVALVPRGVLIVQADEEDQDEGGHGDDDGPCHRRAGAGLEARVPGLHVVEEPVDGGSRQGEEEG